MNSSKSLSANAACVSPPQPALQTPSRWRRFACMMYEAVLLFGVIFLTDYLFDTLTQSHSGLMFRHGRQAILFIAIGAYFVLCWRKQGQTLPMKTWNIRLVDRDGLTPPLPRLILRYILIWPVPIVAAMLIRAASHATSHSSTGLLIVAAPFTLFLWTWLDSDQQFLHDRLLGTRLSNTKEK
ncbi:MAG: RDD family protein [Candidimonas sp.]|nr:MAG: RDD family protein [Candidimonas sp.]TAM21687.1 MAG: RDD family protein [Candidimonas sp.]TAM77637.1 MAG: RDD family protein [Candidimonas sp.]